MLGLNKSFNNKKGAITMYEFEAMNIKTNEEATIFGYNWADACRRASYNVNDWKCIFRNYID